MYPFNQYMADEIVKEAMEVKERTSLDQAKTELAMLDASIEGIKCENGVDVSAEILSPGDFAQFLDVMEGRAPRLGMTRSAKLLLLVKDGDGSYNVRIEGFNFGEAVRDQIRQYFSDIQDIVAAFNSKAELRERLSYVYELLKLLYLYLNNELHPVRQRQMELSHDIEKVTAALGVVKFVSARSHFEYCRDEEFEKSIAGKFEKFQKRAQENGVTEELTVEDVKEAFYSKKMLGYSFLNDERAEFQKRVDASYEVDNRNMVAQLKSFFYLMRQCGLDQWGSQEEMARNTLVGMGEELREKRDKAAREIESVLAQGAQAVAAKKRKAEEAYVDLGDVETTPPPDLAEPKKPAEPEKAKKTAEQRDPLKGIFDVDEYDKEVAAREAEASVAQADLGETVVATAIAAMEGRVSKIDLILGDEDVTDVTDIPEVPLAEIIDAPEVAIEEIEEEPVRAAVIDDAPEIEIVREIEVPDEVNPPEERPKLSMDVVVEAREATARDVQDVMQVDWEEKIKEARIKELKGGIQRMTNFGARFSREQADFIYGICFGTDGKSIELKRAVLAEKEEVFRRFGFDTLGSEMNYVALKMGLLLRVVQTFANDSKEGPEENEKMKEEIYEILLRDQSED